MSETTDRDALIAEATAREIRAHQELIRILCVDEHTRMSIPANPSRDTDLIIQASLNDIPALVAALTQSERDLTELGTAFRDYKIVHPEGTEDLHRKLAEQAAVIEAVRAWYRDPFAGTDDVSFTALAYILSATSTEGTR